MTDLSTLSKRRGPFISAGVAYLLLICLLALWAATVDPRVGFAQAHNPPAGAGVHAAARSKQPRRDIARFGERVQAALASTGNDKAY